MDISLLCCLGLLKVLSLLNRLDVDGGLMLIGFIDIVKSLCL